jgi:hypothetical protein
VNPLLRIQSRLALGRVCHRRDPSGAASRASCHPKGHMCAASKRWGSCSVRLHEITLTEMRFRTCSIPCIEMTSKNCEDIADVTDLQESNITGIHI